MLVSESPTDGLWIDDIQLEPGATATPYAFMEPLPSGESALDLLQGEWVSLASNMVENSSFEVLDGGLPKGWTWDQRNTDATMVVDDTVAHSGRQSLRIRNGTPFCMPT